MSDGFEERPPESGPARHLLKKPEWVTAFEGRLAAAIPVRPDLLSLSKLLVVTPLIWVGLMERGLVGAHPHSLIVLFLAFALLDYLDGVVARGKSIATGFGRILDRATDLPLLLILSYYCLDVLPLTLLLAKIFLDVLLIVLFVMGKGSTENRARTAINYTTLLALLLLSRGWGGRMVTADLVRMLLAANIVFSATVALYNLEVIQKRFLADALSAGNLLCGVISIKFASMGRPDFSLLFLMVGAALDGFDGAAARRWGGTAWGVYSDDVADAVNYGIAPGAAIWLILGGVEGIVLGLFYTVFTISRLVFFTLNKSGSDPNFFRGVPSTVGGLITLSSLTLFESYPVLIGLMVGLACAQMVSFDTYYRHLGRALSEHRRVFFALPPLAVLLVAGGRMFGIEAPVAVILAACLIYGFQPMVTHFVRIIAAKRGADRDAA